MAITHDGRVAGSVSGGCVEGAVVEIAQRVIRTGEGEQAHFGVADETAWSVGLACGGSIDVAVEPFDPATFDAVTRALADNQSAATVTVLASMPVRRTVIVDGGESSGSLGDAAADRWAREVAALGFADGKSRRVAAAGDPTTEIFVDVATPPPTLVMVGGVHIAVALDALARSLGYRTVVVDPRAAFGSAERFPHVDRLLGEWPDDALRGLRLSSATAVAVLTHDPKLDDPALFVALRSRAFYVGALGSRKTQEKRRVRLLEAGITPAEFGRLRAPIGIDLGGRSPEEIALSVLAQIVAVRNGKDPLPQEERK